MLKRSMSLRSSAVSDYLKDFKDKVLSVDSVKQCVERISEGRKLFLQDLFRHHDKDASGFICRDELEHVLRDLKVYDSDASHKSISLLEHLQNLQKNLVSTVILQKTIKNEKQKKFEDDFRLH